VGRKGARPTAEATATSEQLVAELEPLGEVSSRKMLGGYGISEGGLAERSLAIARVAKR
jgi:hypothetical protein